MIKRVQVKEDIFDRALYDSKQSYWSHFLATRDQTADTYRVGQAMKSLHGFQGWALDGCSALASPFGRREDIIDINANLKLYVAIVMNKGAHFVIDQLSIVLQLAKRHSLFISIVEYGPGQDGGSFLLDLVEGALVLADIPYRVEQLEARLSTEETYYPLVEAQLRNLAIGPLLDMQKGGKTFDRVLWLRGFICPSDIYKMIRTSYSNDATMVCGMDWRSQGDHLVFTDVWRTRDIDGRTFRKSDSKEAVKDHEACPVRNPESADRFLQRQPFQVMCCEGGSHVVDPKTTYYKGLRYRVDEPRDTAEGDASACMDSAQMHFCRDIWISTAQEGYRTKAQAFARNKALTPSNRKEAIQALINGGNETVARILIHPQSLTTYEDGSHSQLVSDFGRISTSATETTNGGVLTQWQPAPRGYVCHEMRTKGGRTAPKTQRWLPFDMDQVISTWAEREFAI